MGSNRTLSANHTSTFTASPPQVSERRMCSKRHGICVGREAVRRANRAGLLVPSLAPARSERPVLGGQALTRSNSAVLFVTSVNPRARA